MASFLFHATERYHWQKVDVIGIYLALNLFLGWKLTNNITYAMLYVIPMTAFMGYFHKEFSSFHIVPLLFAQIVYIKLAQGDSMWFLGPFLAGATVSELGRGKYSDKEDELHGAWHLLTATGFYLM